MIALWNSLGGTPNIEFPCEPKHCSIYFAVFSINKIQVQRISLVILLRGDFTAMITPMKATQNFA